MILPAPPAVRHRTPRTATAGSVVQPFARALAILAAFSPDDKWMTNGEIALGTGLPPSTVSRLVSSLVSMGYLRYSPERRQYCLTPSVLALGYAAMAQSDVQRLARIRMHALCDDYKVHVTLSRRDRLNLVLVERCVSPAAQVAFDPRVGSRLELGSTPAGWALLAALPEVERYYLMDNLERRMPREWQRLRRRSSDAVSQVMRVGFCSSIGEWDSDLSVVAAPLMVEGHAPLVLTCVGRAATFTRARVDRDLGPRLAGVVAAIAEEAGEP